MTETVSISISTPMSTVDANSDIVITAGKTISGWKDVSITRRCDGFPNEFSLTATSLDPVTRAATPGDPGDLCVVRIGDDKVVTGYVDQVVDGFSPSSHTLTFTGRGKTQDLVDCSAEVPNGQILGGDAMTVAELICGVYSIDVSLENGASPGPVMPQWALDYGETGANIVQRLAQNAGLIAYEGVDGQLLLANVGAVQTSSGISAGIGGNVESASSTYSMNERFSDIVCALFSKASYSDIPGADFFHTETDPNVRRHRQLDVTIEAVATDPFEFAIRRAKWELARRAGRSTIIQVTVDSWRDGDGNLWAPNTLVPISLPSQRFTGPLLIASVTYRRDSRSGTHAELTLMPKEAFTIKPISLLASNTAAIVTPGPQP